MRRLFCLLALGIVFVGCNASAAAEDKRFDTLRIDHPVARATPPGARTAAVYFTVDNAANESDRLVRASTPVAGGVVLHQMAVEGGTMKMRAIPSLEIMPGARFELKPDGYHLMLVDLKQPLKVGETFPLMLTFERAGTIRTIVTVEALGGGPAPSR